MYRIVKIKKTCIISMGVTPVVISSEDDSLQKCRRTFIEGGAFIRYFFITNCYVVTGINIFD